jgi:hypothetical protein
MRISTTVKAPKLEKGADFKNWSSIFLVTMEIGDLGYFFAPNYSDPGHLDDSASRTLRQHKAHARAVKKFSRS